MAVKLYLKEEVRKPELSLAFLELLQVTGPLSVQLKMDMITEAGEETMKKMIHTILERGHKIFFSVRLSSIDFIDPYTMGKTFSIQLKKVMELEAIFWPFCIEKWLFLRF